MQKPGTGRARASLFMVSAGSILGGCSVLPDYDAPQMRLSDHYSILQPIAVSSRADTAWWRAFNDPALDGLIDRAAAQNLNIAQARARVREAEALARRAGLSDIDGSADIIASSDGRETVGLALEAIFSPRKRTEVAAAQARLDGARNAETDARRLVVGELALAYADLRYAQALLSYRHQDLRSRRRTLNDITAQFDAQVATRLDTVRAQALLAQTEAQIPQTEAQIAILESRIATLLGEPAGRAGVHLGATGIQPMPRGGGDIGVPADLLRARPDVRQAERLYAAAVSDLGAAEAARWPRLSLSGLIRAPLGGGSSADSLDFGVAIPIFSQPALAAGVNAAEARVDQALISWKSAVLTAVDEVESALLALAASRRTVAASARVVQLNQEALDLSRQLFLESGQTTVLDVLDRERTLSDARVVLAQAQRDVARDYIRLYTALGLEDGFGAPPDLQASALPVK
jgi:multidrug efflux system outer membrane protein